MKKFAWVLALVTIFNLFQAVSASADCESEYRNLLNIRLKGLPEAQANDAYRNCLLSGGKKNTGSKSQLSEEERLERAIFEALGKGDVAAASSLVAQLRRLNAAKADSYLSQITSSTSQGCTYNGKYYASCDEANRQYQIDFDNYNKALAASNSAGCNYNGKYYASCDEANRQYQIDLDRYNKEAAASGASSSSRGSNNAQNPQSQSTDLESRNLKNCNAPPDSPYLKITFGDKGPLLQVTVSEKGEKAIDLVWSLGMYSSEKQKWSWSDMERSKLTSLVIEPGLQSADRDYVSLMVWAENLCGRSQYSYDSNFGASSGRSELLNTIPLARKVVDTISTIGAPDYLRLNRGEYFLVTVKSKLGLPMSIEILTPLTCNKSDASRRVEGIALGDCKIRLFTTTSMNKEGTSNLLDIPVKDGDLCYENQKWRAKSTGKLGGRIAVYKMRKSDHPEVYESLIALLEGVTSSKTDKLVIDFNSSCPTTESITAIEERIYTAIKFTEDQVASYLSNLKSKSNAEAEAKAKAEEEAKAKAEAEAKAKAALSKKATITCVKGKISKKVTAVNPKCPTGYKKK